MAKTFKDYLEEAFEDDDLNIDDPDDEENPLAGKDDNDLRKLYSRKQKANLKKKYDAMMAGEKNEENRSTNESEVEVSDEMRGRISDWIDKFSKYKGGNGDTLPEGYMQWALNSGIATDFYEQNEVQAFNKMKGYDADSNDGEWSDGDHDDFTGNESGASPITTACLVELNKITGDDFIEDNAHIIDAVMHGDGNESTELDRIKELAGASIDETYEDDDDFYNAYGEMWYNEDDIVDEAEYQGRKVKLGKPMQGDVKKFKVYVKDPKTGNVKKVNFGHGGSSVKGKAMSIKKSNPARRRSFRARHNCDNPGPRTKARYWSCRKW